LREIILIGGGGHCKSVIDVIELESKFKIVGIVEKGKSLIGQTVLNYEIIGSDEDLEKLREKYEYAFVTVGQIKNPIVRIKIFKKLKELNFKLPVIISPLAYVSKYSKIEEGTIIMHHALVNANTKIGQNCIVNSKALIEHDVVIEDFCHISTAAVINGGVIVKRGSFIGSNSVTKEYIEIKENSFIKAGSLVK